MKQENSNNSEKTNYPDYIEKIFTFNIPKHQSPERIDQYLTRSILNATRTKVQKAIENGNVEINGRIPKPSQKIQPCDEVVCRLMKPPPIELIPEDIPLDIVYEDDSLLVVNKPPGMCTHPGYGNRYGTLVNAVLYHTGVREAITIEYDEESEDFDEGIIFASDSVRPGVVHRLDKDTSGLLLVSKNPVIHAKLAKQFEERTIKREYNALVWGNLDDDIGTISGNIGRSLKDRKLFDVVKRGGKTAITDFEVIERYEYITLVRVKLRTGRTHQIRVHFKNIKHPVFGDPAYGGDSVLYGGNNSKFKVIAERCLKSVDRQMLHAATIGFHHPDRNEFISFKAALPKDMEKVISEFQSFQEQYSLLL